MLHVVALLSIAASCRDRGADATVVALDTSSARDSLEAVTSPRAAVADSIAALDASFQEQRASLNAEARDLGSADRRSPEYRRRFEDWHRRAIAAESLRAGRDRLRARSLSSPRPR
jgi:hypothetical protein